MNMGSLANFIGQKKVKKTDFVKNLLASLFTDNLFNDTTLSQIYLDVLVQYPNISIVDTCDNMIAGESNKQEPDSDIEDSLGLFVYRNIYYISLHNYIDPPHPRGGGGGRERYPSARYNTLYTNRQPFVITKG
jgi:hypothetical protein